VLAFVPSVCLSAVLVAVTSLTPVFLARQNQPLSAAELLRAATHDLGSEEVGRMLDLLSAGMDDDCCICLEPGGDCITRCKHVFHQACISRVLQPSAAGGGGGGGGAAAAASTSCPLCRAPICGSELLMVPTDDDAEQSTTSVAGAPEGAGSKSAAMLRYITQNSGTEGQMVNKFVVFSQFTRYLDLLEPALTAAGLRFVRLDGSKSASQRKAALEAFRDDDATTVFLVSLKAGGVGLNLTTANHVLLLDPW
jgi:SWI/SNF-related matrix-associated actin-dependent regulator of chromatin subfamily A3